MSQHAIRFNGHISWEGRSNGLPETVYAYILLDGGTKADANDIIERQSAAFLKMQAMAVQREQGKIIDLNITPQDRVLVPFRWIISISVDVIKLTGELSQADEEGVERLKDGSEPVKQ